MQDSRLVWNNEKVIKEKVKQEPEFIGLKPSRSFKNSPLVTKSLAAATIQNPISILNKSQQLECAKSYINNGIVRTVVDRSVYFIHGERTDFVIEPNDELTVGLEDTEIRKEQEKINNSPDIKELRRKIVRVNKRCELHDRSTKLLTSTLLFGRGALEIVRFPKNASNNGNWPIFGEPRALKHLSTPRILEANVNETTSEFEGFLYEQDNTQLGRRIIKATDMVPAFHDDNNVFDNSYYSGISAVWPILSVAQTIDAINDEDLPESARQLHAKFGIMYAGTSNKSTLRKLKENLEASTWLIHNEAGLTADVHDLARDLMELPNVQQALAKYICQCMNLPLFLLFEDTANFATANQVMQVYKAGILKRYRTWYQGILEKYWYDPMLADHLGIELKDVISADIKIKAIFPDINFETRMDVITADEKLQNMQVFNPADTAKDIDRNDIAARLEQEQAQLDTAIQQQRDQSINEQQQLDKNGQPVDNKQPKQKFAQGKPVPA